MCQVVFCAASSVCLLEFRMLTDFPLLISYVCSKELRWKSADKTASHETLYVPLSRFRAQIKGGLRNSSRASSESTSGGVGGGSGFESALTSARATPLSPQVSAASCLLRFMSSGKIVLLTHGSSADASSSPTTHALLLHGGRHYLHAFDYSDSKQAHQLKGVKKLSAAAHIPSLDVELSDANGNVVPPLQLQDFEDIVQRFVYRLGRAQVHRPTGSLSGHSAALQVYGNVYECSSVLERWTRSFSFRPTMLNSRDHSPDLLALCSVRSASFDVCFAYIFFLIHCWVTQMITSGVMMESVTDEQYEDLCDVRAYCTSIFFCVSFSSS